MSRTQEERIRVAVIGSDLDDLKPALDAIELRGPEIVCFEVRAFRHAVELAQRATEAGFDRVVAVGGDGTLHEVVQGVMAGESEGKPAVGLVPRGTANDFARQHDAPLGDPAPWLEAAVFSPPRALDLGVAGARFFVNVATVGFAAQVSDSTDGALKDSLGRLAYVANALGAFEDLYPVNVRLRGPQLQYDGKVYGVFVGNGRQVGGGFQVTAGSDLHDGLLDVLIVPEVSLAELGIVAAQALLGAPNLQEHTELHRVAWLELESDDVLPISLDGELLSVSAARFEARVDALRVALPPEHSNDDTPVGATVLELPRP